MEFKVFYKNSVEYNKLPGKFYLFIQNPQRMLVKFRLKSISSSGKHHLVLEKSIKLSQITVCPAWQIENKKQFV